MVRRTSSEVTRLLSNVGPGVLAAYMRAHQWSQQKRNATRGVSLWIHDETDHRAIVPIKSDYADYSDRVGDLVRAIAAHEQREWSEVLDELLVTSMDIVRLRLRTQDADTAISLERGLLAMQGLSDAMLFSACAAKKQKLSYGSRRYKEAVEFQQKLRLGQTEEGSFIIRVLSHVPPELKPPQLELNGISEESGNDPFERLAIRQFCISINSATEAASEAILTGEMTHFTKRVKYGVSTNLLASLASISEAAQGAFHVEVSWSRNRSTPTDIPRRVEFSPEFGEVFGEAARVLSAQEPEENFELEGFVVGVERSEDDIQHNNPGTVTIAGTVNERTRKVRVQLANDEYLAATQAHTSGLLVSVEGTLRKSGNFFEITSPTGFAVLEDDLSS